MAYAEPVATYQFLDDTYAANVADGLPANSFSIFDLEDISTMEDLLDMDNIDIVKSTIAGFRKHKDVSTYSQFLTIAEKILLGK